MWVVAGWLGRGVWRGGSERVEEMRGVWETVGVEMREQEGGRGMV